jgi:hypothetical protein
MSACTTCHISISHKAAYHTNCEAKYNVAQVPKIDTRQQGKYAAAKLIVLLLLPNILC